MAQTACNYGLCLNVISNQRADKATFTMVLDVRLCIVKKDCAICIQHVFLREEKAAYSYGCPCSVT